MFVMPKLITYVIWKCTLVNALMLCSSSPINQTFCCVNLRHGHNLTTNNLCTSVPLVEDLRNKVTFVETMKWTFHQKLC